MFLLPNWIPDPASLPTPIFNSPDVKFVNAVRPKATFVLPLDKLDKALLPIATLKSPEDKVLDITLDPIAILLFPDPFPLPILTLLIVALAPTTDKLPDTPNDPVIPTDPVNSCVFAVVDPLRVDPVLNSIDDVMVCTTIFCAVNVPLTTKSSADDAVAAYDEDIALNT